MYATANKKVLNMLILNILEQYSDAEHRWTQQEIGSLLKSSYDKYDDISHYRLDKMTEVEIIDEKLKPQKEIKDFKEGFHLPKYMAEHIYMFYWALQYGSYVEVLEPESLRTRLKKAIFEMNNKYKK